MSAPSKQLLWNIGLGIWIAACVALYFLDVFPVYPAFLKKFFTAKYLQ
jgi:hypothetical protein